MGLRVALVLGLWVLGSSDAKAADPPECEDGIDNDGDGLVDYPADPGCFAPDSASEGRIVDGGVADLGPRDAMLIVDAANLVPPRQGDVVGNAASSVIGSPSPAVNRGCAMSDDASSGSSVLPVGCLALLVLWRRRPLGPVQCGDGQGPARAR